MSSKINGFDGSPPAAAGGSPVSQGVQSPAGGLPAASDSGSGSIHITDTASQLAALEQATQDLPVVSSARVTAMSSAIEQGTYSVSAENVADNLMQMERALGTLG